MMEMTGKKNILLINVPGLHSFGGMAVVIGTLTSLTKNVPETNFTICSSHFSYEKPIYDAWNFENVEVIEHIWFKRKSSAIETYFISGINLCETILNCLSYRFFNRFISIKNPFHKYDIIIDLNTDSLNEHYGYSLPIFTIINIYLALIVKKPVVTSGASIGIFKSHFMELIVKLVLDNVKIIAAREEMTIQYLKKIGVNKPRICLTADHAFLMQPIDKEKAEELLYNEQIKYNRPLVGISPSELIHRYLFYSIKDKKIKYDKYIELIVELIERLSKKLNATIILIPHSVAPTEDDRIVSEKIFMQSKNNNKVFLLKGDYVANELKGIIGLCDIFIGCRMHASIAASSSGVPTVSTAYGHKFNGILGKMLDQEKYIINIENMEYDDLLFKLENTVIDLFNNKDAISKELNTKMKFIKEKVYLNEIILKDLL